MRTSFLSRPRFESAACFISLLLALFRPTPAMAQTVSTAPEITAVRLESSEVVVTVRVPDGLRRVTLESRERLGGSAWEPRLVARLNGSGAQLDFRLARSRS